MTIARRLFSENVDNFRNANPVDPSFNRCKHALICVGCATISALTTMTFLDSSDKSVSVSPLVRLKVSFMLLGIATASAAVAVHELRRVIA